MGSNSTMSDSFVPSVPLVTQLPQLTSLPAESTGSGEDQLLLMSQAMGSGFKALMQPLGTFAALTLAVNRIFGMAIWLPKAATITGVAFPMRVLGDYTASDYNGVGLYRLDPATGIAELLASTTNDGDFYTSATCSVNYWNRKPFSAPYNAEAGLYYVAFLWNRSAQVTAPALQGIQLSGTAQQGLVNLGALPLNGGSSGFACGLFWSLITYTSLPETTAGVRGNNNSMLLTPVALY